MVPTLLEAWTENLRANPGPVVVLAKGHSGSRFLAEILQRGGVFIGADLNRPFDSVSWHEQFALPIMTSKFWPACEESDAFRRLADRCMAHTLERYLGGKYSDGPWGWKGSTLFVMHVVERYFPGLRCVHLIRDGRDVVTSQDGLLNLPYYFEVRRRNPVRTAARVAEAIYGRRRRNDYRLKVFFGGSDLRQWHDVPLTRAGVLENRYLLQMQSWVHNVTAARDFGATIGTRYREVRYEQLVTDPVTVVKDLFEWLGLDFDDAAAAFAAAHARTGSLRKWEATERPPDRRRDFDRAVAHGSKLLRVLGYLD